MASSSELEELRAQHEREIQAVRVQLHAEALEDLVP